MNKRGQIFSLLVVATTILLQSICFSQKTYYVDTTGSDSNNGTSPSKPWKTLYRLGIALRDSTWHPGDSVLFKYGHKWEPTTTLPSPNSAGILVIKNGKYAGTVSHPIVWGAYGNSSLARPILCAKNVAHGIKLIYGGYFSNWRLENLEIHGYIDFHSGYYNNDINGWTWYNLYLNGTDGAGTWVSDADDETNIVRQWADLYEDPINPNAYHYGKASNISISHCQFKDLPKGFNAETMYRNFYFGYNSAINVGHFLTIGQGTNVVFEYNWNLSPNAASGFKIENQRCKMDSVLIRGNLLYTVNSAWGNIFQSVGIDHLQMYNNTFVQSDTNITAQFGIGWQGEHTSNHNRYAMYSGAGKDIPYTNSLIKNNILITKIAFNTLKNHQTRSQNGFTWSLTFGMDSLFKYGLNFQRNALYNPAGETIIGDHRSENRTEIWDPTLLYGGGIYGYFVYTNNVETDNTIITPSNFQKIWNAATATFPHKPVFTDVNAEPSFVNRGSADTSGFRLVNGSWATTYGEAIPARFGATIYDSGYTHDLSGYRVPQSGSISIGCFQVPYSEPTGGDLDTNRLSTPDLVSPLSGATGIDLTEALTWNPVTGAQRYRLQVAKDSLFITLVVNDSGITSTSRLLSTLEYQKLYYWRVAAINSTGSSAYSIPFRFTTKNEVLPAPSLVTPLVGAVDVNLTPSLTWNSIAGATQYWLQVSPDSLFLTLIVNDSGITTTGYQLSQLEYQKQYHWKVSGKNGSGTGTWSSTWTFRTIVPVPVVPTSALPQDGAGEVALNPRLTWNPVANVTAYRVQVALDSLFASVIVDDSTLSTASLQLPILINNTTYYWHVRAKNSTGTSEYSNAARFTTESQLVVDKEAIDFGNVAIGRSKTDSIKVTNNGIKSVSILNISQTSPLFSVIPQSATIEPDQSLTVTIEFTPTEKTTYTGMTSLSITKAAAVETVTTKGSGIRPPKIKRTPAGVTLLVAPTGVCQDSFRVYNEGDQELFISNAHTTNPKISILPTSGLVASNDSITFFVTAIATKSVSDSGFIILVNNSDLMMDSAVIKITLVGGMQDRGTTGPEKFALHNNYPNPFNPTTTIDYQLPVESKVVLEVYNMLGQVVATLVNETVQAGYRSVVWTATNVPSGIYYCKVDAVSVQDNTKSFRQVKRMTLIK